MCPVQACREKEGSACGWIGRRDRAQDTGKPAGALHSSAKGSSCGSPAKKGEGCSSHWDSRVKLFSRALPGPAFQVRPCLREPAPLSPSTGLPQ